MNKKLITLALTLLTCLPNVAKAEDEAFLTEPAWTVQGAIEGRMKKNEWKRPNENITIPKFGGYIIGSYKFDDGQKQTFGDGFGLRLIRLYVDGTVLKDFKYRIQFEANGSPHIKDATLEWVRYKFFQVKVGQFKRCFTFENPYNPWDVGVGDYALSVKKFSGMGDRCGEASMGGRDLGLQLAGDFLKSKKDGHNLLHYQVAVYNGQGINRKDEDKMKDFIGTFQYNPTKFLTLGVFGWWGTWTNNNVQVDRRRVAAGIKYEDPNTGWSARAEYIHSWGRKASDWNSDTQTWKEGPNGGNVSDGWYATVGIPVWKWIKLYAKYDVFRDYRSWDTMQSIYSASVNLQPHKNLMLQVQYNFNDNRAATGDARRYYNQAWVQTYVRF